MLSPNTKTGRYPIVTGFDVGTLKWNSFELHTKFHYFFLWSLPEIIHMISCSMSEFSKEKNPTNHKTPMLHVITLMQLFHIIPKAGSLQKAKQGPLWEELTWKTHTDLWPKSASGALLAWNSDCCGHIRMKNELGRKGHTACIISQDLTEAPISCHSS